MREKFAELAAATGLTAEEIAAGFLRIAVDNMANAIKKISIQRGFDVSAYVLGCFGGAGGQHACLVADSLSMKKVMIHPFAGVLSAFGMGLADTTAQRIRAVEATLDQQLAASLHGTFDILQAEAVAELLDQDIPAARIQTIRRVHVKYVGSDTAIIVPFSTADEIVLSFNEHHRAQYGFVDDDRCASLALAPFPLIFSYKSEKSLCGAARTSSRPLRSRRLELAKRLRRRLWMGAAAGAR